MITCRFIFAAILTLCLTTGPSFAQTAERPASPGDPAATALEAIETTDKAEKTLDDLIPGLLLSPAERLNYKAEEKSSGNTWIFPSNRYHRENFDIKTLLRMYDEGEYNRILYSLLRFARQGNAKAEQTIGLMYRFGQGVKRDDEQAMRWFSRAAEEQLPLSQHHLGALYFEGANGIARDMIKSAMWLELAVGNYPDGANKDRATSDLDNVKLRLSRLEQIQAADLAKRYRLRYPKPEADPAPVAAPAPAANDHPSTAQP